MSDDHGGLLVPSNREAEQSVLGALLLDNNSIERIHDLPEEAFFYEAHRLIYRAILRQSAKGKAWDVITVAEMLEQFGKLQLVGGLAFVGEIAQNTPSSANVGRYAEIVRDSYTRRQIMVAANKLNEVVATNGDIDTALDQAQASLMAITGGSKADEPKAITGIINEHVQRIETRKGAGHNAIPTGLDDLDDILNGGYRRGHVIVLAARPSMGKTALSMLNASHAAEAGYGVLFLSMEMVAEELSDRLLAATGEIDLGHLLSGDLNDDEWPRMTTALGRINEIPLHIVERSGLNYYQVATYARRHKRKNGLDLLVIDYLQLMAGTDPKAARHTQIEEITRGLKTLAKELNCAVVLLSQLSRKTEQVRRPQLSHLRDSGSIEQDADVVLFIHREEVDDPETGWKHYADIYLAKQRQGRLGRIGAKYQGEFVKFSKHAGKLPDWTTPAAKRGGDL